MNMRVLHATAFARRPAGQRVNRSIANGIGWLFDVVAPHFNYIASLRIVGQIRHTFKTTALQVPKGLTALLLYLIRTAKHFQ